MTVPNDIARFQLSKDVIHRLGSRAAYLTQLIRGKLMDHAQYMRRHGEDMAEIRNWKWGATT